MAIVKERIKHRIHDLGLTVADVASELNINESTYYRKMGDNGDSFSIGQVQQMAKLLKLTKQEAREIFLP